MSQNLPHISLIGDPAENFYQLGLKDREDYHVTLNHLKSLLSTPWKGLNVSLEELVKAVLVQNRKRHQLFNQLSEAYAEGIGRPQEDIAYALLLPEVLSCMSRWLPGLPAGLLGCSSYFFWDEEEDSPVHTRILDFPLMDSFDKGERIVSYQFNDAPKIVSFGSVGFAYPSLTAMTENGVTFALHQKFTDVFYSKGTPIFELIFELLSEVDSYESAEAFIRKNPSITTWALYMSFADGRVMAADIAGEDVAINQHQIEPGKVIYLNNQLENKSIDQNQFIPFGISDYNQMRRRSASAKIGKLMVDGGLTQKKFISGVSRPEEKKLKKASSWSADAITPSSLGTYTMNAVKGSAHIIPGPAPKYYRGKLIQLSRAFDQLEQKIISGKGKKTSPGFYQGMRHLMLAQTACDHHDTHLGYHHIQLAIELLKSNPESLIAQFFFLIFQYSHESHEKVLFGILQKFKALEGNLPDYLNDLCLLYISRLEKIFLKENSATGEVIKNPAIQKYYQSELKIPAFLLHKATAKTSFPRIDLLDVIFIHLKI